MQCVEQSRRSSEKHGEARGGVYVFPVKIAPASRIATLCFRSTAFPAWMSLMTRFAMGVMETQNWRAELKVVVADARRELIPWDASARAFQPGSGAHLRICLGKLDSRLTCSLVASPLSADSSLPPRSPLPFHPLGNPHTAHTRLDSLRRINASSFSSSENIPSALSPGYFSSGVRSHCRVRIYRGDQELDLCRRS